MQLLAGSEGELSLVVVVPNYLGDQPPPSKLPGASELENHHRQLAEEYIARESKRRHLEFGSASKGVALERFAGLKRSINTRP